MMKQLAELIARAAILVWGVLGALACPALAAGFDRPDFVDTFASLDHSRWQLYYNHGTPNARDAYHSSRTLSGPTSSMENECYEDKAVTLGGLGLILTATRDSDNTLRLPFTSGVIVQRDQFAQLYGYFEIVARLPAGQAAWPAFWLLPRNRQWPPELDVVEVQGDNPRRYFATPHTSEPGGDSSAIVVTTPDLSQSFHKFGLLWTADRLTWFFDDHPVGSRPTSRDMHIPMYMIANLAVGGWEGGPSSATPDTMSMYIRRIDSYRLGSWPKDIVIPATPPPP